MNNELSIRFACQFFFEKLPVTIHDAIIHYWLRSKLTFY